jgi:hypothetical protein
MNKTKDRFGFFPDDGSEWPKIWDFERNKEVSLYRGDIVEMLNLINELAIKNKKINEMIKEHIIFRK